MGGLPKNGQAMRTTLRRRQNVPQGALIGKLTPQIRGWANDHRSAVASDTFARCDNLLWRQLWRWATRRHPKKSGRWVAHRYWLMQPGTKWTVADRRNGGITSRLARHADIPIKRHVKVRGTSSPYDGHLRYWATRLKDHPLTDNTMGRLLAKQKSRCPHCGLTYKDEDLLEIDHIIPSSQGGNDTLTNKQALHRHCHDQKSAKETR